MGCNLVKCLVQGCGNVLKACQMINGVCPSCHGKGLAASRIIKSIKSFLSCL